MRIEHQFKVVQETIRRESWGSMFVRSQLSPPELALIWLWVTRPSIGAVDALLPA